MLAGGAEAAIIPSGIGGFIACRALSSRNQDPTRASRPWDKNRDGFVMGEGAGVRLLLPVPCCSAGFYWACRPPVDDSFDIPLSFTYSAHSRGGVHTGYVLVDEVFSPA